MSKCHEIRKEIKWEYLRLTYETPEDFALMRWQTTNLIDGHYVTFRLLFFISVSATMHLLTRYASEMQFHTMYVYFTHWTFLTAVVYGFFHLIAAVVAYTAQQESLLMEKRDSGIIDCKWLNSIVLILANISHNCGVCVTLAFWCMSSTQESTDLTWACKMYHLWLGVILIMNYVLMSIRLQFMHFHCSLMFGFVYGVFSMVYTLSGGLDFRGRPYIYKLVDWHRQPLIAVACLLFSLMLVVLVQFGLHLLDRFKLWLYYKFEVAAKDEEGKPLRKDSRLTDH